MPKNYIDLRIVLSYEKEDDIRFLKDAKVKVSRTKGLTPIEVECLADIFFESDKYREMLVEGSIQAIDAEGERLLGKEAEDIKNGLRYPPELAGIDRQTFFR